MSLPEGWEVIDYKKSFKQLSTTHKKVKTKDCLNSGKFSVVDQGQELICGYLNDEEKVIKLDKPVIVFGDHTRVIKWIDFDFIPGADGTKILEPKDIFFPKFFYYQMRNITLPDKGYSRHFKFLKEVDFLVPPLAQQKQIAQKLDTLLAHVEKSKSSLEKSLKTVKRFRQSVLASAVSGELSDGKGWDSLTIDNLLENIRYGTSKKCSYDDSLTPVLRIPNVKDSKIDTEDIKSAKFNDKEFDALALKAGDILVIRSNGSLDLVGKNVMVTKEHENYIFAGYLIRLRLNLEIADPMFIHYVLSSPQIRAIINLTAKSTSGVNNLNSKEIGAFKLNLPPLKEQTQIVKKVETLFALADRLEANITQAQQRVDRLTQSILAKAFRGEL